MSRKLTTEEFIKRAKEVHSDKYDYSKVEYVNYDTKVCIICPIHGEFWQTPNKHLSGYGCLKCSKLVHDTKSFIEQAQKLHGDKYDYSKVEYISSCTKVTIICPIHGEFLQTPNKHLQGRGCPICANNKKMTTKDFIEKAQKIHDNKYDYSKVECNGIGNNVLIICPTHGEFLQTPYNHLKGFGCKKCANDKMSTERAKPIEQFIEEAQKIHGDKYDYSKVEYKNYETKVCIICPIHGEFWQMPREHLSGCGCQKCNSSKLETEIRSFLNENNIVFEEQKHFDWLGKQTLDFFLPNHDTAIECQGIQHFRPIDFGGKGMKWAENLLSNNKKRDEKKKLLCSKHNIKIIYYSNLGIEYPYDILEDKKEIINEINNE